MINKYIKAEYDSENTILECNKCGHLEVEWYNDQPADVCPKVGCKGRFVRVLKSEIGKNKSIKQKYYYVIHFVDVFENGYVRWVLSSRHNKVKQFDSEKEVLEFASKFRFKWLVNFICYLCNKTSERNFDFRTYKVKKINRY